MLAGPTTRAPQAQDRSRAVRARLALAGLAIVLTGSDTATAERARKRPLEWRALILVLRHVDTGRWQLGFGLASGTDRGHATLGYHVTDRGLLRLRAGRETREAEAGYAIGIGKIALLRRAVIPARLFVLAGAGHRDGEVVGHTGLALRVAPISGVDWIALELGGRASWASPAASGSTVEPLAAARGTLAPRTRSLLPEGFASLSVLWPRPRRHCVVR
jgi:hypothetical protein